MLNEFNKILKEVKLANEGVAHYICVAIAKILLQEEKAVKKASKNKDRIKSLIQKFWDLHNKAKKRSNDKKIREALKAKVQVAVYLVNHFEIEEIEAEAGKWADFIIKTAGAYVPTINRFGKEAQYLKYA